MMKKILLLALMALCSNLIQAQKLTEGALSPLKNAKNINIAVDYSQMIFDGLNEKDYDASLSNEQKEQWQLAKEEFVTIFISYFNQIMLEKELDLVGGVLPDAKYNLTVVPLVFDANYNMRAEIIISEQNGGKPVAKISLKGNSYRFGTRIHKAKGSFKTSATNLAGFLAKKI
jgi:hypothetical protein